MKTKKKRARSLARREGNRYRIPASEAKAKRNAEIIEMLKEHSESEVAKEFGMSKQGIAYVAITNNLDLSHRTSGFKSRKLRESEKLGKIPDVDLAREFNVDPATVANARRALGIPKYLSPIGCKRDKKEPYANAGEHGVVCKACYGRWLYRQGRINKAKNLEEA